ncbi:hypothetical protein NM688_g2489 [Phlebia brevispora]|uniref:Uncharacterized protein n=1 Tax=Phlebia brevispora TaxID=194682 RepID=A0ACC1T868_9APHY|nr:hypothetical protein NM688_g2489 [Phlebia brevispora]
MSPSCCSGKSGSGDGGCKYGEIVPSNIVQKSQAESIIQDTTCCTGSVCGCDETCLEKLARIVCADDDDHIHTPTGDDASDTLSVVTGGSCKCDDAADKQPSEASNQVDKADKPAVPASEDVKTHSCGLRKRKTSKTTKMPVEACGEHKSLVRNRYKDTLAAFGCVCKAMLARGLQSCCTPHPPIVNSFSASLASVHSAKGARRSLDTCAGSCCGGGVKSRSRISIDSCCQDRCCGEANSKSRSRLSVDSCCQDGCCGVNVKSRSRLSADSCRDGCCGGRDTKSHSRLSVDSCCHDGCCDKPSSDKSRSRLSVDSCCAGGKCAAGSAPDIYSLPREVRASSDSCCSKSCCGQSIVDNAGEKADGAAAVQITAEGTNHAVLAVKGMTCTGCENKLIRALQAQATITNIKTSLVLARAEFDYSGEEDDLQTLISAIEKRTGFSAEQIESTPSACVLELLVDTSMHEKFFLAEYAKGIQDVTRVNKKTIRVLYDPHIVGARDVLAHYAAFSPVLAPEPQDPALVAGKKHLRLLLVRTFLSAILTIPVLVMTWAPLPAHPHAYAVSSLILASIVQIAIAGPFYQSALKSLFFSGLVETDLLIVLSTTTAYIYSVVAFAFQMIGRPLDGGSFFETSTLLVTLIMCGQLASAFARQRAVAAISLRSLQQKTATIVLTQWDGRMEEKTVDVRLLHYNDTFRVHPDSVIITDGTILSGSSSIDESMMTGESVPVEKTTGSEVLAGTTNGAGSLLVKVSRLPGENTISEIASMVDDARFSRARIQSIVDRICTWFVPVVLAIAILTFVIWIAIGIRVRKQGAGEAAVKALTYAIAVLAISCPCAIGLAVPMVVLVASGVAARLGLVFKAATTIESARTINHVVFDKTGTLTMGRLEVVSADIQGDDAIKPAILALTSASHHPVARAISGYLVASGVETTAKVQDVKEVTGRGVEGTFNGAPLRGGNAKWLKVESHPLMKSALAAGLTTFCVIYGGNLLALFALSDTLRPEASAVLSSLSGRGIRVSILSGDHVRVVDRVASLLNVPSESVRASCLPADKAAYIRDLQARGEKVMFCGDGTNDSVALAQADIGVHMSSDAATTGAGAAASSASDAVLIRPSLSGLISLLDLSEAVHRRIILNFSWSAVYNLVAVLFAAGAFVNARISPAYAGLGEIFEFWNNFSRALCNLPVAICDSDSAPVLRLALLVHYIDCVRQTKTPSRSSNIMVIHKDNVQMAVLERVAGNKAHIKLRVRGCPAQRRVEIDPADRAHATTYILLEGESKLCVLDVAENDLFAGMRPAILQGGYTGTSPYDYILSELETHWTGEKYAIRVEFQWPGYETRRTDILLCGRRREDVRRMELSLWIATWVWKQLNELRYVAPKEPSPWDLRNIFPGHVHLIGLYGVQDPNQQKITNGNYAACHSWEIFMGLEAPGYFDVKMLAMTIEPAGGLHQMRVEVSSAVKVRAKRYIVLEGESTRTLWQMAEGEFTPYRPATIQGRNTGKYPEDLIAQELQTIQGVGVDGNLYFHVELQWPYYETKPSAHLVIEPNCTRHDLATKIAKWAQERLYELYRVPPSQLSHWNLTEIAPDGIHLIGLYEVQNGNVAKYVVDLSVEVE